MTMSSNLKRMWVLNCIIINGFVLLLILHKLNFGVAIMMVRNLKWHFQTSILLTKNLWRSKCKCFSSYIVRVLRKGPLKAWTSFAFRWWEDISFVNSKHRLLFSEIVEYDYIVILKYVSVFVCFLLFPFLQTKYCLNGLEETVLYILWKQAFWEYKCIKLQWRRKQFPNLIHSSIFPRAIR